MHRHVRLPLLNAVGTSHRRRLDTLLARPLIDVNLRDHQLVGVEVLFLALGVRNRRAHQLLQVLRARFLREAQDLQSFLDLLAAHEVDYEPDLLRRHFQILESCCCFHDWSSCHLAAGFAVFSTFLPLWPLKVRVCANSPSLWPTMFSEMYTGTNLRPLWTAIVWPTMSGMTVERRDHVLMTFLSRSRFIVSTFFCRWPSMNGPFLSERAITWFSACSCVSCDPWSACPTASPDDDRPRSCLRRRRAGDRQGSSRPRGYAVSFL